MTYFEAKNTCESVSSKLAEPLESESEIIYELTKTVTWIGINDIQKENEYDSVFVSLLFNA